MLPTHIPTEPLLSPPDTPPGNHRPLGAHSHPSSLPSLTFPSLQPLFPKETHTCPLLPATTPSTPPSLPAWTAHQPLPGPWPPGCPQGSGPMQGPACLMRCPPQLTMPQMPQSLLMKSAPSLGFERSRVLVPTQPCSHRISTPYPCSSQPSYFPGLWDLAHAVWRPRMSSLVTGLAIHCLGLSRGFPSSRELPLTLPLAMVCLLVCGPTRLSWKGVCPGLSLIK